jgi:molecular chaperone GrpE
VPEEKTANQGQNVPVADTPEIAEAMKEAMAALDQKQRPQAEAPTRDAADVVTEAMIKAKHELEAVLEQTKKETEHFRDKWMRAAADLENYKKRASKERDEVAKFANEKLLKDFLPIVDDVDRALASLLAQPTDPTAQILIDGVKMVQKKFISQLEKHQVVAFESEGEVFDPARHEAVQQINSPVPAGKVVTQLQRGFLIHDRLLRPAMVVVSLGPGSGPSA